MHEYTSIIMQAGLDPETRLALGIIESGVRTDDRDFLAGEWCHELEEFVGMEPGTASRMSVMYRDYLNQKYKRRMKNGSR